MKLLPKKRRQEGLTNYTKRRRLLEGRKPRIAIRKSNRYLTMQLIQSKEARDSVIITVNSSELKEFGWPEKDSMKNLAACYLTGLLFGKKIHNHPNAIVDTGLIASTKGSKIYSAIKGIIDSGYKLNCGKEVIPAEERIKMVEYFDKVKKSIEGAKHG